MSIKTATLNGVATIEIARPEKKNALDLAMYEAWAAYDDRAIGSVLGDTLRRPAWAINGVLFRLVGNEYITGELDPDSVALVEIVASVRLQAQGLADVEIKAEDTPAPDVDPEAATDPNAGEPEATVSPLTL